MPDQATWPGRPVIKAIAHVMGEMEKLGKTNKNQFDDYQFTSIDDFLAATGRSCAEHGLIVLQNEVSREIVEKDTSRGKKAWLIFDFHFFVIHESGDKLGPMDIGGSIAMVRSVAVPFTGAQSFGSAQSYALKQFMRSLFQIATGDVDDPDSQPSARPHELPQTIQSQPQPQPEPTVGAEKATMLNDPITVDTINELDAEAMLINDFGNLDIFRKWIEITCGKEICEISDLSGHRILDFLKANKKPADWAEQFKVALGAAHMQYKKEHDEMEREVAQ